MATRGLVVASSIEKSLTSRSGTRILANCSSIPAQRLVQSRGVSVGAPSSFSAYFGKKLQLSSHVHVQGGVRHCPRTGYHCARRTQRTQASFLGVGAPEALLVGVVALIVFGPRGLAEAAKGVGKTLRAFQPTLKELASVSSDLKRSLEQEIGLDEIRSEFRQGSNLQPGPQPTAAQPRDIPSEAAAGSKPEEQQPLRAVADDLARDLDEDIEKKRAESAKAAWAGPVATPEPKSPAAALSIEDLEAELNRRKQLQQ